MTVVGFRDLKVYQLAFRLAMEIYEEGGRRQEAGGRRQEAGGVGAFI